MEYLPFLVYSCVVVFAVLLLRFIIYFFKNDIIGIGLQKLDSKNFTTKILLYLLVAVIVALIAVLFTYTTIIVGNLLTSSKLFSESSPDLFLGWTAFLGFFYMLIFEYGRRRDKEKMNNVEKLTLIAPIPLHRERFLGTETKLENEEGRTVISCLSSGTLLKLYLSPLYRKINGRVLVLNDYKKYIHRCFKTEREGEEKVNVLFSIINQGGVQGTLKEVSIYYIKRNDGQYYDSDSITEDIGIMQLFPFRTHGESIQITMNKGNQTNVYDDLLKRSKDLNEIILILKYKSAYSGSMWVYQAYRGDFEYYCQGEDISKYGSEKYIESFTPLTKNQIKEKLEPKVYKEIKNHLHFG